MQVNRWVLTVGCLAVATGALLWVNHDRAGAPSPRLEQGEGGGLRPDLAPTAPAPGSGAVIPARPFEAGRPEGGRPARTLRCRVLHADGTPASSASVTVHRRRDGAGSAPLAAATTDVRGQAALSWWALEEALLLIARTAGHEARLSGRLSGTQEVVLRPVRSIRVLGEEARGFETPGLRVLIRRPRDRGGVRGAHEQVFRMAEGTRDQRLPLAYEQEVLAAAPALEAVALLQDGTEVVGAVAPQAGPAGVEEAARLGLPPLTSLALTISAPRWARPRVRVRPVQTGAEVPAGGGPARAPRWSETAAAGEARRIVFGGFRPGEEVEVLVEAPGLFPTRERVSLSADAALTRAEVSMSNVRPQLRMRLVTPAGVPLANRKLSVIWTAGARPLNRGLVPPQFPTEDERAARLAQQREGTVRTDDQGQLRLVLPADSAFSLALQPYDRRLPAPLLVVRQETPLPAGWTEDRGDVPLTGPILASGRVTDPGERPVAGASVRALRVRGTREAFTQGVIDRARTDSAGYFVLLGRAGEGALWLQAEKGEQQSELQALREGREGEALQLLPPASVRGDLEMAHPEIRGQISVRLERLEEREGYPAPDDAVLVNDRPGRGFVLRGLLPGTYQLVAIYDRMEIDRLPAVEVAPGENLDLGTVTIGGDLRPLTVTVTSPEGNARPGVVVRYLRRDPSATGLGTQWMTVRVATTDRSGRAVAHALASEEIALMALVPGSAPIVRERPRWPEQVVLGEPVSLRLQIPGGAPAPLGLIKYDVVLRAPGQSPSPVFGTPEPLEIYPGDRNLEAGRLPAGRYEVAVKPVWMRRHRPKVRPQWKVIGTVEFPWLPARQTRDLSWPR